MIIMPYFTQVEWKTTARAFYFFNHGKYIQSKLKIAL